MGGGPGGRECEAVGVTVLVGEPLAGRRAVEVGVRVSVAEGPVIEWVDVTATVGVAVGEDDHDLRLRVWDGEWAAEPVRERDALRVQEPVSVWVGGRLSVLV